MMSRVFQTISKTFRTPARTAAALASLPLIVCMALTASTAGAVDDAYRPPSESYSGQGGYDTYRQAPPALGEHTERVLTGILGMSAEEIAALRTRGII